MLYERFYFGLRARRSKNFEAYTECSAEQIFAKSQPKTKYKEFKVIS